MSLSDQNSPSNPNNLASNPNNLYRLRGNNDKDNENRRYDVPSL